MSVRSITDLAVKRSRTPRTTAVASSDPQRDEERSRDVVISAVPTEVLALYTTVTGGALAAAVQGRPEAYLPYRWGLLVVCTLLTPAAVLVSYRRKRAAGDRAWPVAEAAASTVAALAWFLATPGSPLLAVLNGTVASMTSVAIVAGAATLLTMGFGQPLRTGAADPPTDPPKVPADTADAAP